MRWVLLLLVGVFCGLASSATKEIRALQLKSALVRVDGYATEPFWDDCEIATGFTQYEPGDGIAPSEETQVRVAYNEDAIYVLARLSDGNPGGIVKRLARRDRVTPSDDFVIEIDSDHDHVSGRHFAVNAAGTQRDGVLSKNGRGVDAGWDGVWESGVSSDDAGWTAEMKIPFHCLRFGAKESYCFGVNFRRFIARKRERTSWIAESSKMSGYVSRFGHLNGITGIEPGGALEPISYVSMRGMEIPATLSRSALEQIAYSMGADFKYGWGNNAVLNAAINPDFCQVEADRVALNLTTYETFYPEKRPFFQQGSKIFHTPLRVFYSRRIGRKPTMTPLIPAGGEVVSKPQNTTILGAAKLMGKTENGTEFALVEALTQQEMALVRDGAGGISESEIEPQTLYQVGRVKRRATNATTVGLLAAMANRRGHADPSVAAADWQTLISGGRYRLEGQGVVSRDPESGLGQGWFGRLKRESGSRLTGVASLHYFTPALQMNHLGFLKKTDRKGGHGEIHLTARPNHRFLTRGTLNLGMNQDWTLDGIRTMNRFFWNGQADNKMGFLRAGMRLDLRRYDDAATRGGPLLGVEAGSEYWGRAETNNTRCLVVLVEGGFSPDHSQEEGWRAKYVVTVRPSSRFQIQGETEYRKYLRHANRVDWVADEDGRRVDLVADVRTRSMDIMTRLDFVLNPQWSLEFCDQLFMATGDYGDARRLVSPFGYADPGNLTLDKNRDFWRGSNNASLLLRWEIRPGTTLYTVWTQGRRIEAGAEGEGFVRDWRRVLERKGINSFLLKLSHRFFM